MAEVGAVFSATTAGLLLLTYSLDWWNILLAEPYFVNVLAYAITSLRP